VTRWPLTCESCGAEIYIGTLYGGECKQCHLKTTLDNLGGGSEESTDQSALGDFA